MNIMKSSDQLIRPLLPGHAKERTNKNSLKIQQLNGLDLTKLGGPIGGCGNDSGVGVVTVAAAAAAAVVGC